MKKQFKIGYVFGTLSIVKAYTKKEAIEIYCYENGIAYKNSNNLICEEVN